MRGWSGRITCEFSEAWPFRLRAALHTGGAWSLMWLGASSRSPARPRLGPTGSPRPYRPASALAHIAAELLNFACNSPATISNIEFTALKLQCFQTLLNLHPIELHATFLRPGSVAPSGSVVRFCVSRCAWFLRCPPRRGCFGGWMKERSPLRSTVWLCGVPL